MALRSLLQGFISQSKIWSVELLFHFRSYSCFLSITIVRKVLLLLSVNMRSGSSLKKTRAPSSMKSFQSGGRSTRMTKGGFKGNFAGWKEESEVKTFSLNDSKKIVHAFLRRDFRVSSSVEGYYLPI